MLSKTQNNTVQDFRAKIANTDLPLFDKIFSLLENFEYVPQASKSKTPGLAFINNKLKERVAKFTMHGDGRLHFHTKFFDVKPYPPKYRDSLGYLHDNYGKTYWRCNCESCGKCKGEPQRYVYENADGKIDFFCGSYLYEIRNLSSDDIQDVMQSLSEQHQYFLNRHSNV
jgi:hypothetical protein